MATPTSNLDLPNPNPESLRAAHRVADDAAAVAATFPPAEEWQREFPECYTETPRGKFNVAYRNLGNTAAQNQANSRKVQEMIAGWAAKSLEISTRRDAALDTVKVRGMDGVTMCVPVSMEKTLAAKGAVKPVKFYGRGTSYWTDSHGQRWKKRHRGEWEHDHE